MQKMKNLGSMGSSGRSSMEENIEDEEISRLAISTFQSREEEIERKKMEVKEKVEIQLGRAEEETRRLSMIWEELEVLSDPLRKEVAMVRKKIDMANRELKPLGQSCQKKISAWVQEKEYKEALEAFNEKNKEKAQLVTTLMEMLTESERLRMKKLEELSKNIESIP
ncbi:RAB6-interacting golgin - like 1 [Theobroma cacao]|nr:RAB6-interacting golgin - like 1 [Theobroma cacao]